MLVVLGVGCGGLALELWVRAGGAFAIPDDHFAWEQLRPAPPRNVVDAGLGEDAVRPPEFEAIDRYLDARPPLDDRKRDAFGALRNEYDPAKAPGVERLLFLGDSVTHRGYLIDALRARADGPSREWWNTGVEAFGIAQAVRYYERFSRRLAPDHIVLTFHNNDLTPQPVAFVDERARLVTYQPGRRSLQINSWLLRHSHLYRRLLHAWLERYDFSALVDEVRMSLARLQRIAREDGTTLSVVLHPVLAPRDQWTARQEVSRSAALEIFEELGLRSYDLLDELEEALEAGIDVTQVPGDVAHPSHDVAERFAASLLGRGLLDPEAAGPAAAR